MDNKSLIVPKKSIFDRIKNFFKNIFKKEELQEVAYIKEKTIETKENKKSSFIDSIRTEEIIEKEEILKIQRDYENGVIREEDMTPEQVSKIEKLYIEQIYKLRNDYSKYKDEATKLKGKLATN